MTERCRICGDDLKSCIAKRNAITPCWPCWDTDRHPKPATHDLEMPCGERADLCDECWEARESVVHKHFALGGCSHKAFAHEWRRKMRGGPLPALAIVKG